MQEITCLLLLLTEQRHNFHRALLLGVPCQLQTPYVLLSQADV